MSDEGTVVVSQPDGPPPHGDHAPQISPDLPPMETRPLAATAADVPSPADDAHLTRVVESGAAKPVAPADRDPLAGYALKEELGRGGMGVVYLARQRHPGRLVALKMVLAGPQARPEEFVRFRREVEAIAAVPHPNLVTVYEVGEYEGRPFYVMEYVDGGSLARWVAGKPQPPPAAARVVEALARAMHAVHVRGIVHRDLKPANVLLQFPGGGPPGDADDLGTAIPKIADFGLAKSLTEADGPTLSGAVLGTPSYMAPEQAAGRASEVGPAADVYALGAILYEMLTGRPPFRAATVVDTMQQVLQDDPVPPRRLQPTVPADLDTVCLKCLRKEPLRRYDSAAALADDLARFLREEPVRARPIGAVERGWRWARRRPALAALLLVIGLAVASLTAGGIAYQVRLGAALRVAEARAEEGRQRLVRLHVAHGSRLLEAGDPLAALPWFAEALRLSDGYPDEETAHRIRLAVALRQGPRLAQLWSHPAPIRFAAFAAGGRLVLIAGDDGVARVHDTETGEAVGQPLVQDRPLLAADISPDGDRAVTTDAGGTTRLWEVSSGLVVADLQGPGSPPKCVAFAPDGRKVLTAGADNTARLWDARTGAPLGPPLRHDGLVCYVAFSADGALVVTVSTDQTARVWDVRTRLPVGPLLGHDGPVVHAGFSPGGTSVVTACADGSARVWDIASGQLSRPPLGHGSPVWRVAFSPDGRRILTAGADHAAILWDAATGVRLARLGHRGGIRAAAFSPDGKRVVTAGEDNLAHLWDAGTGTPLGTPLRHNGTVRVAAFHPGGRLVLTAASDGIARLWDVGSDRPPPAAVPSAMPVPATVATRWLSPDGRRVVMAEGDFGARLHDAATGQPLGPLLPCGSAVLYAAFCPDGRRLVTGGDDDVARIWDGETGELLAPPLEHASSVVFTAVSPDGRWVVTAAADRSVRVWDAHSGEPLTPPLPQPVSVRSAEFGADGLLRLTGADGSVREYDLTPDPRPVGDLLGLAHLLDGRHVEGARGLLPLTAGELQHTWLRLRPLYPETFAHLPPAAGTR
jgi:WD40 repeat protein